MEIQCSMIIHIEDENENDTKESMHGTYHSYFETDENEGRIQLEGGCGNNSPSDVHERMEETAEVRGRTFQSDDEAGAAKTFISQVEQGNNTVK